MSASKLTEFLDSQHIRYSVIEHHTPVYTAQEIAATAHISGKQLAKTVMVKLDGKLAMAVLPASQRVHLNRLRELTGAQTIELARESEMKARFPDCQVGAMPPFGNLYDIPVYAAQNLSSEIEIAFCAGSHTELVQMAFDDFTRLVEPVVLDFAYTPT
jgi:Ala-tRNA(Pro) deacylase